MKTTSAINRMLRSPRTLIVFTIVGIVGALVFTAIYGTLTSSTVRPADDTSTQSPITFVDTPVADPDLDLRFSDPIVRLVPGERLLTISGTVYGIPMDRLTARIGYRLSDGSIVEAMGSSMPTAPTKKYETDPTTGRSVLIASTSRQLDLDRYRQFEIPDSVTVAEPVVLLYNDAGDYLVMITGQPIDVSNL